MFEIILHFPQYENKINLRIGKLDAIEGSGDNWHDRMNVLISE